MRRWYMRAMSSDVSPMASSCVVVYIQIPVYIHSYGWSVTHHHQKIRSKEREKVCNVYKERIREVRLKTKIERGLSRV